MVLVVIAVVIGLALGVGDLAYHLVFPAPDPWWVTLTRNR
jgi:hypothetical protein